MTVPSNEPSDRQGYQPAPGYEAAPQHHEGPPVPQSPPKSIDIAKKLMWAGGIVSLLSLLTVPFLTDEMRTQAEESLRQSGVEYDQSVVDASVALGIATGVVISLVGVLLWFLMAHLNAKGKSWARIVATVLFAVSVVSFLCSFMQPNALVTIVLNLVLVAIGAAAVFFLWRKDSAAWFDAHRARG